VDRTDARTAVLRGGATGIGLGRRCYGNAAKRRDENEKNRIAAELEANAQWRKNTDQYEAQKREATYVSQCGAQAPEKKEAVALRQKERYDNQTKEQKAEAALKRKKKRGKYAAKQLTRAAA
jgi:hypothetical protein